MNKFFSPYLAGWCVIALLFLYSCAQQVTPQGGERDKDAPKILSSSPLNESTNFTGNKIVLEFDEFVALKNASQELVVSPPLKYPVSFKIKNKKVEVSWTDTLNENSTYLFQFGKGIADVNENNVLDSNLFVFSTGSHIDSFELSGSVVNGFDLKPVADIWVMLYDEDIDSLPLTEFPRYFAKTDASGQFQLRYLRPGDYKIFALKPVNGGYTFDIPTESIAFSAELWSAQNSNPKIDTTALDSIQSDSAVEETTSTNTLYLFEQEDSTQYIKSFSQLQNKGLVLEFNRPVDTLILTKLTHIENISSWTENWSKQQDSVSYWFEKANDYDSLNLIVNTGDFIDTLFFRKPKSGNLRGKKGAGTSATSLILKPKSQGKQPHFKPYIFLSETPIASLVRMESILFKQGDDTLDIRPYLKQDFYGFTVDFPWKQEMNYSILIPDSLINDRFGLTNDTLRFNFSTTRKEDFGQVEIKYHLPDNCHSYIWQLLKSDGKIADERIITNQGKVNYPYQPTGKYQIRIIYDSDENGKWSTGYYPGKRQPEKVKYYEEVIEVRSNWASEVEWNLLE